MLTETLSVSDSFRRRKLYNGKKSKPFFYSRTGMAKYQEPNRKILFGVRDYRAGISRAQRYISGSVRSGVESFAQAHLTVVLFACVIVDIPVRECLCRRVAGFSDHV